jgi:hypothetical protein
VVYGGVVHTVIGLAGTVVRLADAGGGVVALPLASLMADPSFELAGVRDRRVLPPLAELEALEPAVLERALWWERHLLEVLGGPAAGKASLPAGDLSGVSLASRERAKAAQLASDGHAVTARTVKHMRQKYQAGGLLGLTDRRTAKRIPVTGRVDERVVAAMRAAIDEADTASSRTASFVLWRTAELARAAHGDAVAMPSRRTLYRLFAKLAHGRHTTGAATTRQSLAARPQPPFGEAPAAAPGELMQIDSTPLDVLVAGEDGRPGRVELTGMIDVATRTLTAAVLRPSTKSVDASVLLARTLTPEAMRPGWADALRMSRSVLPHQRLMSIDERLEHAAARPVIVPHTIVCDHGKVFVSRNFRLSCQLLGINFQPARQATPTDKPHIENCLGSVGTLFAQFVAGYAGWNTQRRGRAAGQGPLWSMLELQELLDEWIVAAWQNRPHDGLRDPAAPGRMFTPNQKYAALVEAAGYVPVALSASDYIELLPARWQAIGAAGIRIKYRTYDAGQLNPLRCQPSGDAAHNGRWEIHHDPYDISRVWVRNPAGGWITAFWKHLHRVPVPFGELAWDHVRAGRPGADEQELADAVAALLTRAHTGPKAGESGRGRADRKVAARTRAVPRAHSGPQPADPPPAAGGTAPATGGMDTPAAVTPLPVFDPFTEARKRW